MTPAPAFSKPLVGTYTILSSFLNCEHQMFRRYIKKDQEYVETPEMKWGTAVHTAFEHRIGSGKPLPDTMRQWEHFAAPFDGRGAQCEQKLAVNARGAATGYWDKDAFFRGKVDVSVFAKVPEPHNLFIGDFKTGGSKYEDPFELEIGALLVKARWPSIKKASGSYIWLKENRMGQLYDLSDFHSTWARICNLMEQIADKRQTDDFEKHKSGLCGWCSVKDCENWRERK